jgi:hypothetical protein
MSGGSIADEITTLKLGKEEQGRIDALRTEVTKPEPSEPPNGDVPMDTGTVAIA